MKAVKEKKKRIIIIVAYEIYGEAMRQIFAHYLEADQYWSIFF